MVIAALFGSLALFLLMGIPVGFAIAMSSTVAIFLEPTIPAVIIAQKMVDSTNSFTLMALPLFVLSGAIMVYGSTPRIMAAANLLLRKKRWGIGNVAVIGCAAFGTISGSGVATTAAIGSIVAPEMVKKGYSKAFTAGLVGGSGTLGIIIPPSICFVVYAQATGGIVSINDMFLAGFLPGILCAAIMCILNRYMVVKNNWGADNQDNQQYDTMTRSQRTKILLDAVLPMLMPFIILGGVLSGAITATEAASIAVIYALFLSWPIYRELNVKEFFKVFTESAVSSSAILLIMATASPFAWLLTFKNVTTLVGNFVHNLSSNYLVVYGIIIFILIILGFFMETMATIMMTVPIFLPLARSIGVDPVAYGITSIMCGCIGGITPPLAVNLFTACKILKMRVEESIPEVFYVCGAMLAATLLTAVFPQICTLLPQLLG